MKKSLSILLVLVALFGCLSTVSASEIEIPSEKIDYIVESATRGTSKPTKKWDWSDGEYGGRFSNVMYGVYTNYYFTGVTALSVEFYDLLTTPDSDAEDTTAYLVYTLIDLTDPDGSAGPNWGPIVNSSSEKEWSYVFSDLNSSHNYCIHIRTNGGDVPLEGRILVNDASV